MRGRRRAIGRSWRLAVLFLLILVPAAATLVGLGLLLFSQDRKLIAQRQQEAEQHAADTAVASFTRSMSTARAAIDRDQPLPGTVVVHVSSDALEAIPPAALLWTPLPRTLPEMDSSMFADAE